jgi:flagellar hook-length control protein FliK
MPSVRAPSDADTRDASPFSELLDTPAPAPEPAPAPRQTRSDRPDRPDRADQPDRSDKSNTDAKPVNDSGDTKDSQAADQADDTKSDKDAKDAKSSDATKDAKSSDATKDAKSSDATKDAKSSDATKDAKDAKGTKDAKDPKAVVAGDKSKSGADQAAAVDAALVDAATPAVVTPQAVATTVTPQLALAAAVTEGGTPEADALAALQAAAGQGQRVGPDAAKPGQAQAGGKPANGSAKGEATAGAQAAVPGFETGKDGQTQSSGDGKGDKAFSEFHRAAAELLAKAEGHAPAPSGGDAASAIKPSADAVQNLGLAAPANAVTSATTAATATAITQVQTQAPAVAVPLSGLAVEIATHADAGRNHFEIRLDPPDLGRINVKLDIDHDGNVTTHLVVDRADTLDLLKRDASSLERALQQAGLKTSDNALDFSLRQHSFAQDDTPTQGGAQQMVVPEDDPAPLEALRQGYGRLLGLSGGLDIRV